MNQGLAIFKKRQRLQHGTEEVPPWLKAGYEPQEPGTVWTSPSGVKKVASAKDASGLYAPELIPTNMLDQYKQHLSDEREDEEYNRLFEQDEKRKSVYGTMGIDIDGQEIEVPVWYPGMTRENVEEAARMRLEWGLDAFATDAELEAVQNAAHMGPDDASALQNNYAHGTSSVNQGLYFYRKQLKKPRKPKQ